MKIRGFLLLGRDAMETQVQTWIAGATALFTFLGVVVVWCQLRSLSQQTRLQNFSDYTKRYQEIVLNFPEDINSESFSFEERADREKTMRYMRAYFDLCFEEWYLYKSGLIGSEFWCIWEGGIKTAVSKSAFRQAWKIIKNSNTEYGHEFDKFIEAKMAGTLRGNLATTQ